MNEQEYIGTRIIKAKLETKLPPNNKVFIILDEKNTIESWHDADEFNTKYKSLTSGEMDFSMAIYWLLHGDGRRVARKSVKGESFSSGFDGDGHRFIYRHPESGGRCKWSPSQKAMLAKDWYVIKWPK